MTHANTTSETEARGRISVIMVSYMTGPALMESIRAVQRDPDIDELIVVDNGNAPIDRPRLFDVAARTGHVRIVQGHGNVGFSRACNYGASLATGDFLHFLNPDAVLQVGASRQLTEAGTGATRPWIAGGMLLNSAGKEQRGARRDRLTLGSAFISFSPLHRLPGLRSIHLEHHPMPEGPVLMPTISGANLMTDRESFEALGGFDECYFLHVEDIDICHRARTMGGEVIFVPGAIAMHYGSTSDLPRWRVEAHKLKGLLRFFWTTSSGLGGKFGTILLAPLMLAGLAFRTIWLGLRKAVRGY